MSHRMPRSVRSRSLSTLALLFFMGTAAAGRGAPQGRGTAAVQPSLQGLAGDYRADNQIVQVRLRADGVLTIAVPPQPARQLQSLGDMRFTQKGFPGYTVEFLHDDAGNAVALIYLRPNGSFSADRVPTAAARQTAAAPPPAGDRAPAPTPSSSAPVPATAAGQAVARAEAGSVDAMMETAWLLLEGESLPRDLPAAAGWYRRAANRGNAVAMNNLGWMYEQGFGVPRALDEAIRWYEQSVSKNHPPAMRNLAQLLALTADAVNTPEAREWKARQRAADKRLNCVDCASLHAPRPASLLDADRRATALYRKASEAGDMRATALLASMYLTGRANDQGTPDFEQFARLSKAAAQAGDTQGMWQLYGAHNNGNWGVPKDDAEAIRWVRTAAELGDIRAMNALASEHQRGSRVPRDEVAAMSWWRRAADAGDGEAMTKVAYGYLNGTGGVPRNVAEGVRWTRAAVDAEEVEAASWLAGWYENGERGFARNPTEATAIWRRLARSANPETADAALYMLGEQERDRLFRERLEQQKATSWDFLAAMVKISAVMSAVVLVTGGGGSLDASEPVRGGGPPIGLPASAPRKKESCGWESRSATIVHGSKSIMGGPGTQWVCR
jgi:uncharacterized protein